MIRFCIYIALHLRDLYFMNHAVTLNDIHIRTELKPGDLGYVMYRHGKLYSEEYGYGIGFETYVGLGMHEFYNGYNAQLDRVWIPEHDNRIIGFLLLMHRENNSAQLRYFYLEPDYRGIGLGRRLMNLYMAALHECGYSFSYLWTAHELHSAIVLYKMNGFTLAEEKDSTAFGKPLKEQRYILQL